jgi:hypothetical protein
MSLVDSVVEILRSYSTAQSEDVKKLISAQALILVIKSYIRPDVDLSMAGYPTRTSQSVVPGMRKHDQIWREAVEACRAELTDADYLLLLDEFKARMVTCDPEAQRIAFPDYTPKG